MQEVFEDGSLGEIKTADTLEDLLPMIKESLAHPRVKYVKVFNNGKKVQGEEERTTNKEEMDTLMGTVKKEDEIGPLKKVTGIFLCTCGAWQFTIQEGLLTCPSCGKIYNLKRFKRLDGTMDYILETPEVFNKRIRKEE